jgi:hypothetical protein
MVFGSLAPIIRCLHRRGLLHQFRGAASTADLKRGYYDECHFSRSRPSAPLSPILHKKSCQAGCTRLLGEVITEDWLYL